ncbi:MAG TPA: hypothetical protein VIL36_03795 [Acidimicrobiales bacterium]
MQVEVIEVLDDGRVTVRSAVGTFTAGWDGDRPPVGSREAVELDVGGVALWGEDVRLVDDGSSSRIEDDGSDIRLCGRIVEFGADDVLVVDVGGSPVMLDTDGDPPLGVTGRYVAVRARDVTLYPYNL